MAMGQWGPLAGGDGSCEWWSWLRGIVGIVLVAMIMWPWECSTVRTLESRDLASTGNGHGVVVTVGRWILGAS
eukprot:11727446-Alexandrium_andersonii.AAC.1